MDKMSMESVNFTQKNIEKIYELFPSVVTEKRGEDGKLKKAVNFELLKQILSNEVVEGDEAYEFTWVGKKEAMLEAGRPIKKTLRPCKDESKNWDNTENLYIEGENLDVLKLLQESYLGKVKMIYIDPPYNTGSDSFVYPDNYTMEKNEYEDSIGLYDENGNKVFKENTSSNPAFHSKWCSMIYQRLLLARNLLSDEGAIFIHIDEHEVYALSMICNEVFGTQNELGTIIWDKRNPKGAVAGVAYQHESILVYCKNISVFAGVPFLRKKEHAEEMMAKVASLIKKNGGVTVSVRNDYKEWIKQNKQILTGGESAYSLIDEDGNIYQPVSMAAPDKPENRSHRPLIHPTTGKPCPVPAKGWRFTDNTMDSLIQRHKIEFGNDETTQPRQKYFLKDNMEEAVSSLLYFGGSDDAMGLPFDNPKPVFIAKKLISSLCKEDDDIIIDFFSGSATTAHAVMQLNEEDGKHRKFIMVQYPEKIEGKSKATKSDYKTICEIGKERIRRAGNKIIDENKGEEGIEKLDIGFRVFKLDDTNMKDVYYSAEEYGQGILDNVVSNIKEDRSDLDLLYGCLLEWGLPLSLPYNSEKYQGAIIHIVNEGDLIACFDSAVSEEVVREIAKRQPLRVVFRDSSFENSPAKINVEEIFKLLAPNTRVKVI